MIDLYPAYKPLRNYLRKFALVPSLEQLHTYLLHAVNGTTLPAQYQQSIPRHLNSRRHLFAWDLEIVVREILLNASEHGDHSLYQWDNLARAINHIKRLEGEPYRDEDSGANIFIDLQRMAHRQFRWQSGQTTPADVIRAMKVFGDDVLDTKVLTATGLPMSKLLRLASAIAGGLLRSPWLSLSRDLSPLGIDRATSRALLERLTSDLRSLRQRTQSCQKYDDAWLYATFPLEHHPLIRIDPRLPDQVLCPIPQYLLTRLTTGVFYDIVNSEGFSQPYGESFQRYVGEVLTKTLPTPGFTILEEQPYAEKKARVKHGADWIVSDDSGHLFIECKTKRLSMGARNVTDPQAVSNDLAAMSRAVVQNYKNIADAVKGITAWRPDGLPVFPVIATLENWYFHSDHFSSQLLDDVKLQLQRASIDPEVVDSMPYTIAAVSEMERGLQVVAQRGIAAVFTAKVSADFRPWHLQTFLQRNFLAEFRAARALLFPEEGRRLFPEIDFSRFGIGLT